MNTTRDLVSPLVMTRCRQWSQVVGLSITGFGVIALLGHVWNGSELGRMPTPWGSLKANAALCFMLLGTALWLYVAKPLGRLQVVRMVLAGLSLIVALVTLAQDVFGWELGIDQLIFTDPSMADRPGRMAPNTAVLLAVISIAMLPQEDSKGRAAHQWLGLLTAVAAMVILCGYLYGVDALYVVPGFGFLPLDTALCFLLLGTGTMAVQPDRGLMSVMAADTVGGMLARRLLPAIIIVPVSLGYLRMLGEQRGIYGTSFGAALFAVASVLTIGTITWLATRQLNDSELQRRSAHADLAASRHAGRLAQDALRLTQETTRVIIDSALDAVVTIDHEGVITGWNPRAEQIFGWTREALLGRTLAETVIPEKYRDAHRLGLQRYLATGEGPAIGSRMELSALHRDGREFPVELSIFPVKVEDHVLFSGFIRDISQRKAMERALIESQQHYQALAESLPNLVWTCRPDGSCDFLSRQWLEYTGRPAEEQLGSGWSNQLHPDDRARVHDEWARALTHGDAFDSEFRIRRSDGAYRWFKTRALPLHDASGQVVKWFGSNTDFEDHKRFEQRLQEQLERMNLLDELTRSIGAGQDLHAILGVVLRSLEDHLPIDFGCVGLYDRADNTLVIAEIGRKSQATAEQLGMSTRTRLSVEDSGLSRCVRGELVYEPSLTPHAVPFMTRLARADLHSLVAAPFVVESRVFGVLIVARAATAGFSSTECEFLRQLSKHVALAAHQAELYSALQSAYDDLRLTQQAVTQQERLKALGQMASGIAHDINNAISPVGLYTETLLDTEPDLSPRARKYLSTIQRAIGDVAQTVARMREFYRHQEPQFVLVPVSANRLVREVVELTRARWSDMPQQRGAVIALTTDLSPADPMILGIESDVRESLINLIFNAVDAMPDGGTLVIRTHLVDESGTAAGARPRRVAIEVSDTGVGMDPETRHRCLEPFFTTKGERGTGLGLAMVYGMVQRHDAQIEIESTLGRGTLVRVTFATPTAEREPAATPQVRLPRSSLRVLIVDDDPLLLKSLQDVLESDGHSVTAAGGGELGIAAFRRSVQTGPPFHIVITDLGMPHIDGRQVAAAVREMAADMPVILLTGWGQRLFDESDIPAHVNRVLKKPPRLSELRQALVELSAPQSEPVAER